MSNREPIAAGLFGLSRDPRHETHAAGAPEAESFAVCFINSFGEVECTTPEELPAIPLIPATQEPAAHHAD